MTWFAAAYGTPFQTKDDTSNLASEVGPGVKVSRNAPAVPGPGNLSLERTGYKIIGFNSRNLRS